MKVKILTMVIGQVFSLLTPEILKGAVDALLDYVEETVVKSDNTIDDKIVIPACQLLRKTFDIPDND